MLFASCCWLLVVVYCLCVLLCFVCLVAVEQIVDAAVAATVVVVDALGEAKKPAKLCTKKTENLQNSQGQKKQRNK